MFSFSVFSQEQSKQIYISISPLKTFSNSDFENYWKSNPGVLTEFRFDHHIGQLGAGLSLMKFSAKDNVTLGFYGVDYYFLYRNQIELITDFNLILGFDFGIFEFRFDDADFIQSSAERNEREFAFKLVSGFNYNISKSWGVELGIGYSKVYTKKNIELFSLRIVLVKSFIAPDWIKDFLE